MEKQTNKVGTFFLHVGEGITLGISAAVAGLSAGTIAVAEKIYDPLINSVSNLRKEFKKSFLYLLPFFLGLLLGALAALVGIQRGYKAAPFSLTGLFAGFIFGSVPVAISECKKGQTKKEKIIHIVSFTWCFLLAAGLGIVTALTKFELGQYMNERTWWIYILIFLSGVIAAGACVIPGISGSMTLMVIGMYYPILNTYTGEASILHTGDAMFKVTGLVMALLLILGAIVGIMLSSKFMKVMLEKHRVSTFYSILGLILGSLISMFINSSIYPLYPSIATWDYIVGGILFVAAAIGAFLLVTHVGKAKIEEEVTSALEIKEKEE